MFSWIHALSAQLESHPKLDLVWQARGALWGTEFKYRDTPRMTRSNRTVLRGLPLQHLWIVYPGPDRYRLDETVTVLPVVDIPDAAAGPANRAAR